MQEKQYKNEELIVHWFPQLCSKSGICTRGLPLVFDDERRPWINVNLATAEEIIKIVDKCPSGALKYSFPKTLERSRRGENDQQGPGYLDYVIDGEPTVIVRAVKNGPLITKGLVEVFDTNNQLVKKGEKMVFCRCGMTKNPPFCDGTHAREDWKEEG